MSRILRNFLRLTSIIFCVILVQFLILTPTLYKEGYFCTTKQCKAIHYLKNAQEHTERAKEYLDKVDALKLND